MPTSRIRTTGTIMGDIIYESVVTCPECGFAQRALMPVNACRFYYAARRCEAFLAQKAGHMLHILLIRPGEMPLDAKAGIEPLLRTIRGASTCET